jgi:hypothetical protein
MSIRTSPQKHLANGQGHFLAPLPSKAARNTFPSISRLWFCKRHEQQLINAVRALEAGQSPLVNIFEAKYRLHPIAGDMVNGGTIAEVRMPNQKTFTPNGRSKLFSRKGFPRHQLLEDSFLVFYPKSEHVADYFYGVEEGGSTLHGPGDFFSRLCRGTSPIMSY